jgi:hypothetical protein
MVTFSLWALDNIWGQHIQRLESEFSKPCPGGRPVFKTVFKRSVHTWSLVKDKVASVRRKTRRMWLMILHTRSDTGKCCKQGTGRRSQLMPSVTCLWKLLVPSHCMFLEFCWADLKGLEWYFQYILQHYHNFLCSLLLKTLTLLSRVTYMFRFSSVAIKQIRSTAIGKSLGKSTPSVLEEVSLQAGNFQVLGSASTSSVCLLLDSWLLKTH